MATARCIRNAFVHVTAWTATGVEAFESNLLTAETSELIMLVPPLVLRGPIEFRLTPTPPPLRQAGRANGDAATSPLRTLLPLAQGARTFKACERAGRDWCLRGVCVCCV